MSSRRSIFFYTVGATFLATLGAYGQFTIDPAVNYATGSQPDGVAAADIDGDGDLDLAVVTDGTGAQDRLEFFANDGTGVFSPAGSILLPNSSSAGEVVAGDLDGDGDSDFAVVLKDFAQVQIVLNNGGAFSLAGLASIGEEGRGLDIGDADGDGDLDLVVANRSDNTATMLTNAGNATFAGQTVSVGDDPRGATFADWDGDGDLDVAVSNHDTRSISLLANNAGVLSSVGVLSTGSQRRPEGIVGIDLNGDGLMDLAAASNGNGFESASVFLAQGGNAFSGAVHYPSGGSDTSAIIAADLDCDGAMDLVTRNASSNNVSLLPNLGAGTFGGAMLMGVGVDPDHLTAADLDGDGDADLAVTNKSSNSVSVLLNQTCDTTSTTSLVDVQVISGDDVVGGLADLIASDNAYYQVGSVFGFSAGEPNLVKYTVGATTTASNAATVDLTVEAKANQGGVRVQLLAKNWNTGLFETVHTGSISVVERTIDVPGLDATKFVRASDGRIEVQVKYIAILVFSSDGFGSSTDQIALNVQ